MLDDILHHKFAISQKEISIIILYFYNEIYAPYLFIPKRNRNTSDHIFQDTILFYGSEGNNILNAGTELLTETELKHADVGKWPKILHVFLVGR